MARWAAPTASSSQRQPHYRCLVRGFSSVTATVLIAIAVGVAVVSGVNGGGLGPVGTVSGRLVGEGGALSAGRFPLRGEVTLKDAQGDTFTTVANSKGRWRLEVPPGTYVATSSEPLCGPVQARVRADATVDVVIVCSFL